MSRFSINININAVVDIVVYTLASLMKILYKIAVIIYWGSAGTLSVPARGYTKGARTPVNTHQRAKTVRTLVNTRKNM